MLDLCLNLFSKSQSLWPVNIFYRGWYVWQLENVGLKKTNWTEKGINQTFIFKKKLLTPFNTWFKNTANILDQILIEMVIIRMMGL